MARTSGTVLARTLPSLAAHSAVARTPKPRISFFEAIAAISPWAIFFLLIGPIAAGLLGTFLPAFGYLPAIGANTIGLDAFKQAFLSPGFLRAIWLSAWTGLLSSAVALVMAMATLAALSNSRFWPGLRALIPAFLAVPHAALAIGFAFLIAPSGLFARIIYAGFGLESTSPPDLLIINDPNGWALIAGLALRETPFLLFTLIAVLNRVDFERQAKIARSLGYSPAGVWFAVLLPQLYPRIRLPLFIVIAYGVANVEMALVLGPTSPPTMTILILEWFRDPDLAKRLVGAAAAAVQIGVVVLCLGGWLAIERLIKLCWHFLVRAGRISILSRIVVFIGKLGGITVFVASVFALGVLCIWSIAQAWRFPEVLPRNLSIDTWSRAGGDLLLAFWTTAGIGMLAATTALVLSLLMLEHSDRIVPTSRSAGPGSYTIGTAALYLPLLIPQISFVFGLQIVAVKLGFDGGWPGVILAHLIFVIPYTIFVLAEPYRALDARYIRTARSLGHGPWSVFWRLKVPLLTRPVAFAWAIGFSVSCAQYLTTLFVGQGRVVTLSLEALALMGGGDRRLTAAMALLLALLPFLGFVLVLVVPRLVEFRWRSRQS